MLNLPETSFASLKGFFDQHRDVTLRYFVSQIRKGIRENEGKVKLFKLDGTKYLAVVLEKNYEKMVIDAMNYFVKEEMYEDAATCRDLLREIKSIKDKKVVEKFLRVERNRSND